MIDRIPYHRKTANDNHIEEHPTPKRNGEVAVDGVKVSALRTRVQEVADTLPHLLSPFHRITQKDLIAPLTYTEVCRRINAIDLSVLPAEKAAYYEALLERISEEEETI